MRRNWHRKRWTWSAFINTRRADYQAITAHLYNDLGNLARQEGNLDEARSYYQASFEHFTQLGREMEVGIALIGLANVAREQRAWGEARQLYLRSLEINRRFKRQFSVAEVYLGLAEIESVRGKVEEAQRLKEISRVLYNSLGISQPSEK